MEPGGRSGRAPVLGLRKNLPQFALFVVVNGFVGAMVGLERAVLPVLGEEEFGVTSKLAVLGFIASFGVAKAAANLFVGVLADRHGRRPLLVMGWLVALPVPLLIFYAPDWNVVIFANLLLGVNQGLAWSMTIAAKIDLVGPKRRGLAMGINEFAGYAAVGASAYVAWEAAGVVGSRTTILYLGLAIALLGLLLSLFARETLGHAHLEAGGAVSEPARLRTVFARVSWNDRTLFSASQAGLVNNLNDGVAWGLFPLLLLSRSAAPETIGLVAAAYPFSWGVLQIATGPLSDRFGRKRPVAIGMATQAVGIWLVLLGTTEAAWLAGSLLLGLGTALVYPTLIAAVSDVVNPRERASAVGVYRFWRDAGFVVGAIGVGLLADRMGLETAIHATAIATLLSGVAVLALMRETLPGASPLPTPPPTPPTLPTPPPL